MNFAPGCVLKNAGEYGHNFVIVVADAQGDFLLTNWTTVRDISKCDSACILNPGDHPAITRPSYMYYVGSQVHSAASLLSLVREGNFVPIQPLSQDVLKRIQDGARRSRRLKFDLKIKFNLNLP